MARLTKRAENILRLLLPDVTRVAELAGSGSVDTHEAAGDPHTGYVLEAATDASPWGFVADEDDMVSDSAVLLATQQSIKAYVDAAIATVPPYEVLLDGDDQPVATGDDGWLYIEVSY